MSRFGALRNRLLPAILTAAGVSLIAGGLLTYTGAVEPTARPTPSEAIVTASPPPSLALPTIPPPGTRRADALAVADPGRPRRDPRRRPGAQDRPADRQGPAEHRLLQRRDVRRGAGLGQPGFPGAVYLYAHARNGMFLPLSTQSKKSNGSGMIGMLVEVYTSDNQVLTYTITEVRRHVPKTVGFDDPLSRTTETLWLQTSEGPKGTPTVLQVLASRSGPRRPIQRPPTRSPTRSSARSRSRRAGRPALDPVDPAQDERGDRRGHAR